MSQAAIRSGSTKALHTSSGGCGNSASCTTTPSRIIASLRGGGRAGGARWPTPRRAAQPLGELAQRLRVKAVRSPSPPIPARRCRARASRGRCCETAGRVIGSAGTMSFTAFSPAASSTMIWRRTGMREHPEDVVDGSAPADPIPGSLGGRSASAHRLISSNGFPVPSTHKSRRLSR